MRQLYGVAYGKVTKRQLVEICEMRYNILTEKKKFQSNMSDKVIVGLENNFVTATGMYVGAG